MRLGRERINHLSHWIIKGLEEDQHVRLICDANTIRLDIVRIITQELQSEDEIEEKIRERLSSYSRKIIEGSQEWDVLYQKVYEEKMAKRGK